MDPTLMQSMSQQPQQQQAQPGSPMDLTSVLQRLTPEQLHQLMGLSTGEDQDSQLKQQLARAHAMRKQAAGAQSYGAMAGIGNGMAAAFSGIHEREIEHKQDAMNDEKRNAREEYMKILRDQMGQKPPASPDSEPPELLKKPMASASVPFQF